MLWALEMGETFAVLYNACIFGDYSVWVASFA